MLKSAADEFGVDPKNLECGDYPPRYVGAYAEQDASITLKIVECYFQN